MKKEQLAKIDLVVTGILFAVKALKLIRIINNNKKEAI